MPSFDVVSRVDRQEVVNAVNQARKEVAQRYDLKGTRTELEVEGDEIRIVSDDDFKVKAVVEVVRGRLARRGVPLAALAYGRIEPAAGGRARQVLTVRQGIDPEAARRIVKAVRGSGRRVQAQVQGDQVRVSGKKRDDLQAVIAALRALDLGIPLQFVNFRD